MVERFILCLISAAILCFSSCTVDLFGLFGSTDLSVRLKERNNFRYLRPEDMTLTLGDKYSFILLADTHIENGDTFGLEKIKNVIADENTAGSNIKFAVIVGDITQCAYKEDIQKYIDTVGSLALGIPSYPVIGNHDIYLNNWKNWKDLIGSTCYRINDSGNAATLFMLDSANGYFGNDQLNWLDNELKSAKGRVFVFTHFNFFVDSPSDIQQLTDTRERARVCAMLKGRCDTVFTGHLHYSVISKLGGVSYVSLEDFRDANAYCVVSVSPAGVSYRDGKL